MQLEKDGIEFTITDEVQLAAFLKAGYKTIGTPPPVSVTPSPPPKPLTFDEVKALPDDKLMEYARNAGINVKAAKGREQLIKSLEIYINPKDATDLPKSTTPINEQPPETVNELSEK